MMTVGNSARLLEAAQTCFMSPFPAPAQRRAGESHGCLGQAQASGNSMPWWPGAPSPARPGPARPGSVPLGSVRRLPVTARAAVLQACQATPCCGRVARLSLRSESTEQSKGPLRWPKTRGKDLSEAGSGELVGLAHLVLLGEQCQLERKWRLPAIALFGDKEKPQPSCC